MSKWLSGKMPYANWTELAADASRASQGEMSPKDEAVFRAWCSAHMDFVWVSLYFAATSRKMSIQQLADL